MSEASAGVPARTRKSAQAFRTISEAADELNVPQHVLRFWETKFGQLQPLKRGGGRRYYRPEDLALLRRIADLLYTQGYTIKGVQRLLEEGEPPIGGQMGNQGELLPGAEGPEGADAVGQAMAELFDIARAARRLSGREP